MDKRRLLDVVKKLGRAVHRSSHRLQLIRMTHGDFMQIAPGIAEDQDKIIAVLDRRQAALVDLLDLRQRALQQHDADDRRQHQNADQTDR